MSSFSRLFFWPHGLLAWPCRASWIFFNPNMTMLYWLEKEFLKLGSNFFIIILEKSSGSQQKLTLSELPWWNILLFFWRQQAAYQSHQLILHLFETLSKGWMYFSKKRIRPAANCWPRSGDHWGRKVVVGTTPSSGHSGFVRLWHLWAYKQVKCSSPAHNYVISDLNFKYFSMKCCLFTLPLLKISYQKMT